MINKGKVSYRGLMQLQNSLDPMQASASQGGFASFPERIDAYKGKKEV